MMVVSLFKWILWKHPWFCPSWLLQVFWGVVPVGCCKFFGGLSQLAEVREGRQGLASQLQLLDPPVAKVPPTHIAKLANLPLFCPILP